MSLHPAQHLGGPTLAAVLPLRGRPSLLFDPALPRRRSLLLPERGQRGRGAETARRTAVIAAHLACLPMGTAITVREVIALPGVRLTEAQAGIAADVLRSLGWRAGKGRDRYVREDDAPAAPSRRCGGSVHPAVAAAFPRLVAFLDAAAAAGRSVTEAELTERSGIGLAGHYRRAVGRAARRLGWRPVRPGSPMLVRGA